MKSTLRIPTKDPYAYIEVEFDGTEEEIFTKYHTLTALVKAPKVNTEMEKKSFTKIFDEYCWGSGTMTADDWALMSEEQQEMFQVIKRSKARWKNNH